MRVLERERERRDRERGERDARVCLMYGFEGERLFQNSRKKPEERYNRQVHTRKVARR